VIATATRGSAFGQNALVNAPNGTALGSNSLVQAAAFNSVALGQGSIATQPQTVSVGVPGGERRITNVAPGIFNTDAVNVTQLTTAVSGLQEQITANQVEARAGTALALASAGLQYDTRPGKLSIATALGSFKGESGIASGIGYSLPDGRFRFNASFSASPRGHDYGGTIGSSLTLN
jgi:autotransporter adhesin